MQVGFHSYPEHVTSPATLKSRASIGVAIPSFLLFWAISQESRRTEIIALNIPMNVTHTITGAAQSPTLFHRLSDRRSAPFAGFWRAITHAPVHGIVLIGGSRASPSCLRARPVKFIRRSGSARPDRCGCQRGILPAATGRDPFSC